MAELTLHGKPVASVFGFLGEHENDITYSIAWAMAQCHDSCWRFSLRCCQDEPI
jgi:hypothetical protein